MSDFSDDAAGDWGEAVADGRLDRSVPAPQEPTAQEELLKYFWPHPYPSSHPPTQVMFSNGLPESDYDFIHKVFVVPYHTFKTAIEAEASRRARAAEERILDELYEAASDNRILEKATVLAIIAAKRQALKQKDQ